MSEEKIQKFTNEQLKEILERLLPDSSMEIYEDEPFFYVCNDSEGVDKVEEETGMSFDDIIEQLTGSWENWGYYDEYSICGECGHLVRTQADSYNWTPKFMIINDCNLVCKDCLNPEDIVAELENNPKKANTILTQEQLEELGYEKLNTNSYENGWYEGMKDNPTAIFNELEGKYDSVVFSIDEQSQFYVSFSVYVKSYNEDNEEEE